MRIIEILFYLLKSNSRTTIKQLSELFNVSQKRIQRDLDKLSVIGIPIISYKGINGGIELDKNYILSKYILTEDDYTHLILSLYVSENIFYYLKKFDLIDKFKLINQNRCSQILNIVREKFIIDLDENNELFKNDICKIISHALDNKSFIKLTFKQTCIEVLPICYVLKKEGLCLYCYDGNYRLILLNNIDTVLECSYQYDGEIIPYNNNKNIKVE